MFRVGALADGRGQACMVVEAGVMQMNEATEGWVIVGRVEAARLALILEDRVFLVTETVSAEKPLYLSLANSA